LIKRLEGIKHDNDDDDDDTAGASLNGPSPHRTAAIGPLFTGDLLVVTLLNNDYLLVVTAHEVHLYGLFT